MLGDFRSGRTQLLHRLRERLGRMQCQYIDLERSATTPERFVSGNRHRIAVPRAGPQPSRRRRARPSTRRWHFSIRPGPAAATSRRRSCWTKFLELRTFESFPGLRTALSDLLKMLAGSANRFVLTTRYISRAHRLLKDATSRFEVIHVPPLAPSEIRDLLLSIDGGRALLRDEAEGEALTRAVFTLSDGRVGYALAIGEALSRDDRGARASAIPSARSRDSCRLTAG